MDPLSIAASVAGLLTLAGSVVSNGYALLSKLEKRAEAIHSLVSEVATFSGVLVGVQSLFAGTNADASSFEQACGGGISLQDNIQKCKKTLEEARELFNSALKKGKLLAFVQGDAMRNQGEKLVAEMERYKAFFIICLQLQHSLESDNMERTVAKIVRQLQDVQLGQEHLKKHFEEKSMKKKRSQIIQWLGPTTEDEHNDIVKRRDSNSAQWLLHREEFTEWMFCDMSSYFWLQGIQGCGKTVIVSKVIESIYEICVKDDVALVYHYCSYSDASPEKIVGALLSQVLQHLETGDIQSPSLVRLFDKYQFKSSYPDIQGLHQGWEELCKKLSRVYLVIDGLDQLHYVDKITDFLDGLPSRGVQFKVFVSSRPSLDLELVFAAYSVVVVTALDICEDIEQHVRSRLHQLRIDNGPEADELVRELVSRADGMFLWVVCQLDHLSRVRTSISPEILKALPRGLEQSFEAVLIKLEDEDRQLALRILRCIMYAHAPLELDELTEAIAIQPGMRSLAQVQKSKLRRPSDILEICGSLVRQSKSTGKLSLLHFSVYEFLSSPTLDNSRPNEFFLEKTASRADLLATCITYLNLDDYSSSGFLESIESMQSMQYGGIEASISDNTPFLEHAATSWCAYLGDLGAEQLEKAWSLLKSFFNEDNENFRSWLGTVRYLQGEYKYPVGFCPVHVAAMYNLKAFAEQLLRDNPDYAFATTHDGRTALHIALENASEEVTDLFVAQGALAKVADKMGRSPLHIAIQTGDATNVRRLIDAGADVNAQLPDGATPLSIAIENSWDELATLLTEMADAKKSLPDGRTLLHVAAQSGSLIWTQALIKHHKEMVYQGDNNVWMPLHYAAEHGHDKVAQELLQAGAVAGREDRSGWTALHSAIHRKHLDCAEILLQHLGKDCSQSPKPAALRSQSRVSIAWGPSEGLAMKRKYGRHHASTGGGSSGRLETPPSPLLLAVSESSSDAVELFVKHWKLKFDFGQHFLSPCLEKAIELPSTDILERLLPFAEHLSNLQLLRMLEKKSPGVEKQLKRFVNNKSGHRLLKYAVMCRNGQDVKWASLILERWPICNPADFDDLLCHALKNPRCSVELLGILCTGQDVIPRTLSKRLPLVVAVTAANRSGAEFLIKERSAVSQRNSIGETALLALVRARRSLFRSTAGSADLASALQFLLSHGAELGAVDDKGLGLYHKIILSRNAELLSWALEHPATADLADSAGDTLLSLAVRQNSTAMVQLLLDYLFSSPTKTAAVFLSKCMTCQSLETLLSLAIPLEDLGLLSILVEAEKNAATAIQLDEQMSKARTNLYIGALIDALKQYSMQPLHDWGAIELLISHAPDLDYPDTFGQTPLHAAVRYGSEHHLTLMLQRGVDVDGRTPGDGETPCDDAMRCQRFVIARLLIQWGCTVRPDYMTTAFKWENADLVATLVARGVKLEQAQLSLAPEMTKPGFVTYLLNQGGYVSPSHIILAAKHDDKKLLERALVAFPDEWATMEDALDEAVQSKSKAATEVLSQQLRTYKLKDMPADAEGGTILHNALRWRALDDVKLIIRYHSLDKEFLLTRDNDDKTALILAVSNKDWAASRLLYRTGVGIEEASEIAETMGYPKAVWATSKVA